MRIKIGDCFLCQRTEFSNLYLEDRNGNKIINSESKEIIKEYIAQTKNPEEYFAIKDNKLFTVYDKNLKHAFVPYGIEIIGENAFVGCKKLINIVMPESVCEINDYAFAFCHNLKYAGIPNRVYSVNENIFQDCNDVTF